jgi:hypothetical protein
MEITDKTVEHLGHLGHLGRRKAKDVAPAKRCSLLDRQTLEAGH